MISTEFLDGFFNALGSLSYIVFIALLAGFIWNIVVRFFTDDNGTTVKMNFTASKWRRSSLHTLFAYLANVEPSSSPASAGAPGSH